MKKEVIQTLNFGQRIAEEEIDQLAAYFVETDQWKKIYTGDIDIVYGVKGAGKSAIYSLLLKRQQELAEKRKILIIAAENPRGAPVFRGLVDKPDIKEQELYNLWKLYFLSLIADRMRREGVTGHQVHKVIRMLEEAGVLPREASLGRIFSSALEYVRRLFQWEAVEGNLSVNPANAIPSFSGKIIFREPSASQQNDGLISADSLLNIINTALKESRIKLLLLLDRLDVAFADSQILEHNALRALFRMYLDLQNLDCITFKIFLRSDIWRQLTEDGFRGASHIIRSITISWDEESLLNLVIRRALNNPALQTFYSVSQADILSLVPKQADLFRRIFPSNMDRRHNGSSTFNWMLTHTQDASGNTAPRELIHLLSSAREHQLQLLAVGKEEPQNEALFEPLALKKASQEVSKVRYEQMLCAEHPTLKIWLEKLEGKKTQQTVNTLAEIWNIEEEKASEIATKLVKVGFFKEQRNSRKELIFWVPFLYRDALKMIQGSAT